MRFFCFFLKNLRAKKSGYTVEKIGRARGYMKQEYIRFPHFKNKALTLSYDDGVRQDKRLISIMNKNGLKGTFNINAGLFEETYDGKTEKGRMTVAEALDLYIPSGMEIAVHGFKHLSLPQIHEALAVNDVVSDRKALEKTFGVIVDGMAYAYGTFDDKSVDMVKKCGIKYARTTDSTERFDLPTDWLKLPATCHHCNQNLMALAKAFFEREPSPYWRDNRAQMFYLWGHSYEFDMCDNWNVIEEFAEYAGGREDVWYATNGEIFNYLQACDRLEFSIEGDRVFNPSCIDVYIDFFGKQYVISTGKTVALD